MNGCNIGLSKPEDRKNGVSLNYLKPEKESASEISGAGFWQTYEKGEECNVEN